MKSIINLIVAFSPVILLTLSGQTLAADRNDSTVQLETIVVTPTLMPTRIEDSPGSVQVIDADTIRKMGAQTLAQALSEAVGVDLNRVSGRGVIPQIRGLTNKRVLVLIDGMRFATGFRDTTVDLTEFPVEVIERIEIVRGPTSALYGSEAIGGVINIITRAPPKEFSASGTLQYGLNKDGEAGNAIVKGFVGNTWDHFGVSLAQHTNLGEMFDREQADNFSDFDDETRHSGMLNLNYRLRDNHTLTGGIFYSITNREGLRPKAGLRWDRVSDSDRLSSFIKYDGKIGDTNLMARAYYSDYGMDRSYVDIGAPYADPAQQAVAEKQPDREDFSIDNELFQMELRASRRFAETHMLTLGLEHREEQRSGKENRGEQEINQTVKNQAIFIQDEIALLKSLSMTAGARLDHHSDFGSELSPRLSLVNFLSDNLRIKASYGEGFRAPSAYELYVSTVNRRGDVIANPDLQAETAKSYELGLEGEMEQFRGVVTLFHNDIEDMINRQPTGNSRMSGNREVLEFIRVNVGKAYTQGAEVEASLGLPNDFSLSGNFTYTDTENEDNGKPLLEVPETKVNLRLAYDDSSSGWHANLRMSYIGEQLIAPETNGDAYAFWNLYVEKRFRQQSISLYAGVNNIFDEIPEFISEKGTFIYTGLSARF